MVGTYKYLLENQYVTYLIHQFSFRASCYRIPHLAAAQRRKGHVGSCLLDGRSGWLLGTGLL